MASQAKYFLMVVLLLFISAGTSQATVIRSAASVTLNTFGEWDSNYDIGNVSDQSGLNQNFVSGITDWDSYFSTNPSHTWTASVYEWWGKADSGLSGTIIFDLGDIYYLDKFAIWNEESSGISYLNVSTSADGILYLPAGNNFMPTNNPSNPLADYTANIFNLTISTSRYIMLEITGTGDLEYNTASMGEIAFSTTDVAPVPEPSTALLLGIGLIGSALAGRRMRKA